MGLQPIPALPVLLLAALPTLASCQDESAPAGQGPDRTAFAQVEKVEMPGIENFSRAAAGAGFGGATRPSAMPGLKKEGFASVINLRLASEAGADVDASRIAAEAAGLRYIHLPLDAGDPAPQIVPDFLAAVGDQENQPVYFHCGS